MVLSVYQNFSKALKYRGGWWNLVLHMYTNGDYPFKFGTYMGSDAAGNRYYENGVDYPFGQHRWVEPGDVNNFDSSSIPPEWHGWMTSMNDVAPSTESDFFERNEASLPELCRSDVVVKDRKMVGHQEKLFHFHNMHNQSQVRSRGYGIGNPIVGLPPHAPDAYYVQPGSPYHDSAVEEGRARKNLGGVPRNEKWKMRLMSDADKKAIVDEQEAATKGLADMLKNMKPGMNSRGSGTSL
mmetsp:Transcript_25933/g.39735  ORF Transcript_25933/g.39735 Transcript_25933/m.39735 type:complete len:239 (+) Transcript_25933:55-771(+)